MYDLVEAVTLDGVPGVARPGGGLMVSAMEGVSTVTGATGGGVAGSVLGSGAGGASADSAGGAGAGEASAAGGSGCAGTQPFVVSRPSSSCSSVAAVGAGSSSQLGSWMVAGFSHSVEGGSSAGSVIGGDDSGTEEVDGGSTASVGTCCTGAGGRVGLGTGLGKFSHCDASAIEKLTSQFGPRTYSWHRAPFEGSEEPQQPLVDWVRWELYRWYSRRRLSLESRLADWLLGGSIHRQPLRHSQVQ